MQVLALIAVACLAVGDERMAAAFARFGVHRSCGACVAAGGAWCIPTSRCVPDARGFCGRDVRPPDHVGMAGHGRCTDRTGAVLQAYHHAPRRPPLQPPSSCASTCSAASAVAVEAGANGANVTAARHLETCGLVVLREAFTPALLRELRQELLRKLKLHNGGVPSTHKNLLPGVRGLHRAELVVPATKTLAGPLLDALRRPALLATLAALLGHAAPALEFVSLMASWPGAGAQELHRDTDVASEAALLVFVPLDEARVGGAGPPELCPCTHYYSGAERARPGEALECGPAGRFAADADAVPLGSALVYDPGLVHRGLPNRAGGVAPRLMLHLALAPRGARVRARPEALLGDAARTHVAKWRAMPLGNGGGCRARGVAGCDSCLRGDAGGSSWRTGCAWCATARECVPDLAGLCASADEHVGSAGLGGTTCQSAPAAAGDEL